MNDSAAAHRPRDPSLPAIILISMAVGFLAVTPESLWIDEASSASKAVQPSLGQWWQVLASAKGSDLQMPLYMFYLWAWEKVAGHSEFALRAANIPWLVFGHIALFRVGCRRIANPWVFLALASLNPFLWTYLNEARPYVMQYCGACMVCAFLFRAEDPRFGTDPAKLWFFLGGLLLLCGASLLGVVWAAFGGIAWLFLIRRRVRDLMRTESLTLLAGFAVCLGALGTFYAWTLRVGAGASTAAKTSLLNLAFSGYELIGLAGLGPGRLEMRQSGFVALHDFGWGLVPLAAGLVLWLALLVSGLVKLWTTRAHPVSIAGVIYVLPPILVLGVLGFGQDFRILGRHFMPVTPAILGLAFLALSRMKRRSAMVWSVAVGATWLASALSLRFAERHRKDDYRTAATVAREALARHEVVWWSANPEAAAYYSLPLGISTPSAARSVIALTPEQLTELRVPDLVIASKPDIYDPRGGLKQFLHAHQMAAVRELPAFTIWRQPSGQVEAR